MTGASIPSSVVIPVLRLRSRETMDWLVGALGFRTSEVTPADDGGLIHAQLWWDQDCIMVSTQVSEGEHVGVTSLYITVPTDAEVDAAYERAIAAGAGSVREPVDQPYGGRGATVADPDGNQWSLGSYLPQAPPHDR